MISLIFILPIIAMVLLKIGSSVITKSIYGVTRKEVKRLSWPAKQILKQYRELPVENRPYANIHAIVKALDIKHGVEEVDGHVTRSNYDHSYKSWDCRCYRHCEIEDYKSIRNGLTEVSDALVAREYALSISKVSHSLDAVAELTESLRREKEIIQQVTKESIN